MVFVNIGGNFDILYSVTTEMPSAEMRKMSATAANNDPLPIRGPEFNISSTDVEGLVFEIKENLRLTASSLKAVSCHHLSRKSSRASPYRIPSKFTVCQNGSCEIDPNKCKSHGATEDDPYELLQKLLRDGGLVNEAVRRLQHGVANKRRYSYESDEETSPTS